MDQKFLYAFRGWIAFVAFMDMGTAVRCYIEKRSFLGEHSYKKTIGLQYGKWLAHKLFKISVYMCPAVNIHEM
jgi:hypothetical protein